MWVPGSSWPVRAGLRSRGFTLVELLLVLAVMAIASAGVAFAVRDSGATELEREAQRLVALLDAARAQSRANGLPVYWHADAQGFEFVGLRTPLGNAVGFTGAASGQSAAGARIPWLAPGIAIREGDVLSLGPEPIIEAQHVVLAQGTNSIRIATDGLRSFAIRATGAAGTDGGP